MSGGLNRRNVLQWIGWAGLSATHAGKLISDLLTSASSDPFFRDLVQIFPHGESAAIVGSYYLCKRPDEADEAKILALLALPDAASAEPQAVLRKIVTRHRDDFRLGRVMKLDGWTLTLTELRLCALVYLCDRTGTFAHKTGSA